MDAVVSFDMSNRNKFKAVEKKKILVAEGRKCSERNVLITENATRNHISSRFLLKLTDSRVIGWSLTNQNNSVHCYKQAGCLCECIHIFFGFSLSISFRVHLIRLHSYGNSIYFLLQFSLFLFLFFDSNWFDRHVLNLLL